MHFSTAITSASSIGTGMVFATALACLVKDKLPHWKSSAKPCTRNFSRELIILS
eukprot:NODE_2181_length_450_cov_3.730673_g2102_i0.p4 GENE.NODE_2181_length_450_cov_3.730673_g2102_i0~~NODE_2181_length_450_cov_3.730673_g2102_i0.p4  ORF type:complete len:54 (-),score=11.64 NODE_2181_length_450_cov_3.730673_g2102_i0:58-219(-)